MADLIKTTELDAVNEMLGTIGLTPVNSLSIPIADVSIATNILHTTSRKVQKRGWYFNTDEDYSLPIDVNNEIVIPTNALSVDPSDRYLNVTVRAGKLYDKDDHTYTFDESIDCDIVWFLPFEELPESAREYIYTKAARQFQKQTASEIVLEISIEDERMAYNDFIDAELEREDLNYFDGNRRTIALTSRYVNP